MPRAIEFFDGFTSLQTSENTSNFTTTDEVPAGDIDGINLIYTLGQTPSGSVSVYLDGVKQTHTVHFNVSGSAITFVNAPQVGQVVEAVYAILSTALQVTSGDTENVEQRILTGGEISGKSMTLVSSPASPANTRMTVQGLGDQFYTVDFTVSGNTLTWSGLALDGVLIVGDRMQITYFS